MNAPDPPARWTRHETVLTAFTVSYMLLALPVSLASHNDEFVLYFVVMCVLLAGVLILHRRIHLPLAALWGLSVWGLAHMSGGLVEVPQGWPTLGESRVLYNLWLIPGYLKFDQLVHAYGFGLVTWICWEALQSVFTAAGISVRPTPGLLTLCVAGGMGFGAANEVVEFAATQLLPGTNVGGYENTGWDLVFNLIGSVIAAVWIAATKKGGSR